MSYYESGGGHADCQRFMTIEDEIVELKIANAELKATNVELKAEMGVREKYIDRRLEHLWSAIDYLNRSNLVTSYNTQFRDQGEL